MSRTTLEIDDTVLGELRTRSERAHKSMGRVVTEILATAFAEGEAGSEPKTKFVWHTQDMKMLIDIDDKEELYRVLDGR